MTERTLAEQARRTAALITSRLADPAFVADRVAASIEDPNTPGRRSESSLLAGDAGIALLLRTASSADPDSGARWRRAAHDTLIRSVRSTHDVPLVRHGIVAGSAGLALALSEFAADDHRYRSPLHSLHVSLADQVRARSGTVVDGRARFDEYDVLEGAAGILGHLVSVPVPDDNLRDCVHDLIDALIRLCTPPRDGAESRWTIPPENFPLPGYRDEYPHGYINLGLAHGIPGPLAALSLAWRAGYRRPGMREAIGAAVGLLTSATMPDDFGVDWPNGVPLEPDGRRGRASHPSRTAWCYGAPGIAAALLIAADSLGDDRLRGFSVTAFEASLRRAEGHLDGLAPTLCHGLAGLLAICGVFARGTDSALARTFLPLLTERLLAHCGDDLAFGVQNHEPPDLRIDNPDFLCGAAGVAAALWTVHAPVSRRWQRALLIA
ncbi:lanthionine synthetase C family protein [Streptomyces sp. LARHCF249]